jgi:hypothetical protein
MFGNYDDISNSELSAVIDEWIKGRNAERNRAILKRRMIDGICYEPLAEEFGLSVKQVQNIVYKNEYTIYRHIWHI